MLFRHSSRFFIGRLPLLQDYRELSNSMLRLKENKGRLKGWGWDLGTVPKIISLSFNPSQQMQEVSRCGVPPLLGHPGEPELSTPGERVCFGKHLSWWEWSRSSPSHQPEACLLCAIYLDLEPERSPLQLGIGFLFLIHLSIMGNSEHPSLSAQKSSWKARGTGSRDVYAPSSLNRRRVFLKSPSVKGERTAPIYWVLWYVW